MNVVMKKKDDVGSQEWALFVSMLTIMLVLYLTDIVNQLISFLAIITFATLLLFKNQFIGDIERISFDGRAFSSHDNLIQSLNMKRWANLYFLVLAIILFRIIDMMGNLKFDSTGALTLLAIGLCFAFRTEIASYFNYFIGKRQSKGLEEYELELISSVYNSRLIFSVIITGIITIYASSLGLCNYVDAFFGYFLLTVISLYMYRSTIDSKRDYIYENINSTPRYRIPGTGCGSIT